MKLPSKLLCILIGFLGASHTVNAATMTLTFDEMSPGSDWAYIQSGYGGLQWNGFGIISGASRTGLYEIGMVSSNNVAFNLSGNPAAIVCSNLFDLRSAYLTGSQAAGMQIRVQGFVGAILTYDNTYTLDYTAPTLIDFNYLGVDQVKFTPFPETHFAMDNLTVTVAYTNTLCTFGIYPASSQHSPSPETGSVSLFALGGCAWNVSNTNSWVTITSSLNNTNNGTVTYTVATNLTGFPRSGFITIAGQSFKVNQYAAPPPGTTPVDLGGVQTSTIGHSFYVSYPYPFPPPSPMPNYVYDFLVDQEQSSGGGGVLPSVSANFDLNNQFVLTISAPPGKKFLVQPPVGQAVRFFAAMTWQGNSSNGPSLYGTVAVSFGGLEGTAPDFSPSRTVLSDYHGHFGFNDIQSTAFTNNLAFSSITLTATVLFQNVGSGLLNYNPKSGSRFALSYQMFQTNDPGRFVSIVPVDQPTLNMILGPNGDVTIAFTGTLQSAGDLHGTFEDVPGDPQGTYTIPKASLTTQQYFRAKRN